MIFDFFSENFETMHFDFENVDDHLFNWFNDRIFWFDDFFVVELLFDDYHANEEN